MGEGFGDVEDVQALDADEFAEGLVEEITSELGAQLVKSIEAEARRTRALIREEGARQDQRIANMEKSIARQDDLLKSLDADLDGYARSPRPAARSHETPLYKGLNGEQLNEKQLLKSIVDAAKAGKIDPHTANHFVVTGHIDEDLLERALG